MSRCICTCVYVHIQVCVYIHIYMYTYMVIHVSVCSLQWAIGDDAEIWVSDVSCELPSKPRVVAIPLGSYHIPGFCYHILGFRCYDHKLDTLNKGYGIGIKDSHRVPEDSGQVQTVGARELDRNTGPRSHQEPIPFGSSM